jgi:hypothetical protein
MGTVSNFQMERSFANCIVRHEHAVNTHPNIKSGSRTKLLPPLLLPPQLLSPPKPPPPSVTDSIILPTTPRTIHVALVTQHARRMCCIPVCVFSGPTVFFHVISETARRLKNNYIEGKVRGLIFSTTLSEALLILSTVRRYFVTNIHMCLYKVTVILLSL